LFVGHCILELFTQPEAKRQTLNNTVHCTGLPACNALLFAAVEVNAHLHCGQRELWERRKFDASHILWCADPQIFSPRPSTDSDLRSVIFELNASISRKRWEICPKLLLMTNTMQYNEFYVDSKAEYSALSSTCSRKKYIQKKKLKHASAPLIQCRKAVRKLQEVACALLIEPSSITLDDLELL